jgi:hypothetical protein
MFRGLINDAKSAAGSLIARYLARASVAVPFIIAVGFAIAAITLTLVDKFGGIIGSWMVAGGFTLIGLVATLAVTVKEHEEEVAEQQAEAADTGDVASDAAAQAAAQMPLALLGAALSSPIGPSTLVSGAKMAARNIPLVVLMAFIAMLFWPSEPAAEESEGDEEHTGRPNGHDTQRKPNGYHHEAAA